VQGRVDGGHAVFLSTTVDPGARCRWWKVLTIPLRPRGPETARRPRGSPGASSPWSA